TDGLDELHPDFFQALKDNLFLVENEVDNFNFVSRRVSNLLQSESQYILTINPTLDCNLRCWYCYQKHTKDHFMSKPLIDTVVKFAENIVKKKKVESFVLSFFGGEPLLLANDIALPIAKSISNKCELFKKKFKLHFTTNGTLLTSDILAQIKLISNHVSFQIPFDGNREIHNKIKRSKDIDDTYSLTIKNILDALKFGFHVTIRCNYDESNILSFIDLINDIKAVCGDFMDLINFDFQKIWQAKRTLKLSEDLIRLNVILQGKITMMKYLELSCQKAFVTQTIKTLLLLTTMEIFISVLQEIFLRRIQLEP
ncbi:radical SAM protein, partial [Porphyromonas levii]|uniref:radical SAM protein n=1 Tax=Porphyromonas levii TaxID=28114 RepID=UPI001070B4A3